MSYLISGISGEEFEFLANALCGNSFDVMRIDAATFIRTLTEHLANISTTDVISSERSSISQAEVKRRCEAHNRVATDLCVSLCRTVARMSAGDLALLAALVLGCNIQRNANHLETSLGIAWEEEVFLASGAEDVVDQSSMINAA